MENHYVVFSCTPCMYVSSSQLTCLQSQRFCGYHLKDNVHLLCVENLWEIIECLQYEIGIIPPKKHNFQPAERDPWHCSGLVPHHPQTMRATVMMALQRRSLTFPSSLQPRGQNQWWNRCAIFPGISCNPWSWMRMVSCPCFIAVSTTEHSFHSTCPIPQLN